MIAGHTRSTAYRSTLGCRQNSSARPRVSHLGSLLFLTVVNAEIVSDAMDKVCRNCWPLCLFAHVSAPYITNTPKWLKTEEASDVLCPAGGHFEVSPSPLLSTAAAACRSAHQKVFNPVVRGHMTLAGPAAPLKAAAGLCLRGLPDIAARPIPQAAHDRQAAEEQAKQMQECTFTPRLTSSGTNGVEGKLHLAMQNPGAPLPPPLPRMLSGYSVPGRPSPRQPTWVHLGAGRAGVHLGAARAGVHLAAGRAGVHLGGGAGSGHQQSLLRPRRDGNRPCPFDP